MAKTKELSQRKNGFTPKRQWWLQWKKITETFHSPRDTDFSIISLELLAEQQTFLGLKEKSHLRGIIGEVWKQQLREKPCITARLQGELIKAGTEGYRLCSLGSFFTNKRPLQLEYVQKTSTDRLNNVAFGPFWRIFYLSLVLFFQISLKYVLLNSFTLYQDLYWHPFIQLHSHH